MAIVVVSHADNSCVRFDFRQELLLRAVFGAVVSHQQDLHIRELVHLRQGQLRGAGHIPGNKQVKVAAGAEVGESLLVHVALAHRGKNRDGGRPQGDLRLLRNEDDPDIFRRRQGHQLVPNAVLVLYFGQVQRIHSHPLQKLRQAVGMVGVVVGHRHGGKALHAHAAQLRKHLLGGLFIAVAAAAVHQDRVLPGPKQGAGSLAHIHSHCRQGVAAKFSGAQGDAQNQGEKGNPRRKGVFSPSVPAENAQEKDGVYKHQPPHKIGIGVRVESVVGDGAG